MTSNSVAHFVGILRKRRDVFSRLKKIPKWHDAEMGVNYEMDLVGHYIFTVLFYRVKLNRAILCLLTSMAYWRRHSYEYLLCVVVYSLQEMRGINVFIDNIHGWLIDNGVIE